MFSCLFAGAFATRPYQALQFNSFDQSGVTIVSWQYGLVWPDVLQSGVVGSGVVWSAQSGFGSGSGLVWFWFWSGLVWSGLVWKLTRMIWIQNMFHGFTEDPCGIYAYIHIYWRNVRCHSDGWTDEHTVESSAVFCFGQKFFVKHFSKLDRPLKCHQKLILSFPDWLHILTEQTNKARTVLKK